MRVLVDLKQSDSANADLPEEAPPRTRVNCGKAKTVTFYDL
jgi:hypothetical protein